MLAAFPALVAFAEAKPEWAQETTAREPRNRSRESIVGTVVSTTVKATSTRKPCKGTRSNKGRKDLDQLHYHDREQDQHHVVASNRQTAASSTVTSARARKAVATRSNRTHETSHLVRKECKSLSLSCALLENRLCHTCRVAPRCSLPPTLEGVVIAAPPMRSCRNILWRC